MKGNRFHPISGEEDITPSQLKEYDRAFCEAFETTNPGIAHNKILKSYKVGDPYLCSDVYYMRHFLPNGFSQKLVEWLKSLPHTSIDSGSSVEKINGK